MADRFPVFGDERGTLLPVELDDVPFPVRRLFVVHGSAERRPRGDHVVPCQQLVVLLSGAARFEVTEAGGDVRCALLDRRGDTALLYPGEHVVYHLDGPGTAILVLASEPYAEDELR